MGLRMGIRLSIVLHC